MLPHLVNCSKNVLLEMMRVQCWHLYAATTERMGAWGFPVPGKCHANGSRAKPLGNVFEFGLI